MTPSPAFLREISYQIELARHEVEMASSQGDERSLLVATGRLAELDYLTRRATDDALLAMPSWP